MLLAAAFMTYLAKMPEDAREAHAKQWLQLTDVSEPFQFTRLLSTESQLLSWKQSGLPADSLSRENAIVIVQGGASRVPFIIDPANAAGSWLKVVTTSVRVSNLLHTISISTQSSISTRSVPHDRTQSCAIHRAVDGGGGGGAAR